MNLRPRYNNVIIRPIEGKKQTDSGLILPDTAVEKSPVKEGEVVAVGAGKPGQPIDDLKPGAQVLYANGAGITIEWEKQEYLIMKDVDVPMVIE